MSDPTTNAVIDAARDLLVDLEKSVELGYATSSDVSYAKAVLEKRLQDLDTLAKSEYTTEELQQLEVGEKVKVLIHATVIHVDRRSQIMPVYIRDAHGNTYWPSMHYNQFFRQAGDSQDEYPKK